MLMYLYLMTKLFFSCIVYAKSTFVETAKKYIHSEKPALQKKNKFCKIQAFKCCDLVKLFSKPIFEFFGNHHDLQPHPPPM